MEASTPYYVGIGRSGWIPVDPTEPKPHREEKKKISAKALRRAKKKNQRVARAHRHA